jgi:hypothetical protein
MQQHVERAAARGRMAGNRGRDALSVPAAQEEPGGYESFQPLKARRFCSRRCIRQREGR